MSRIPIATTAVLPSCKRLPSQSDTCGVACYFGAFPLITSLENLQKKKKGICFVFLANRRWNGTKAKEADLINLDGEGVPAAVNETLSVKCGEQGGRWKW